MFTHFFSKRTHANTSEVVDGESGVARVVQREEPVKAGPKNGIGQAFLEFGHAHVLGEILKENLDKNTAARGSFFLVQVDQRKHVPANTIVTKDMAKESSNVA